MPHTGRDVDVKKSNFGFTLIETAIYAALAGIALTGFVTFALVVAGLKPAPARFSILWRAG